MFGEAAASQESGSAVQLRQGAGEVTTAQYLDNLGKSITQVGRLILAMLPKVYDTERTITLQGESSTEQVNGDMSQYAEEFEKMDVAVYSGPSFESKRREAVATLVEVGRMMPQQAPFFADLLVEQLDAPGSKEIAARLKKMLPPELQDEDQKKEKPDPEAMKALEAAKQTMQEQEQTIDFLEGAIKQLQTALIDNENDREASIQETIIKEQSDLRQAEIKAETQLAVERMKLEGQGAQIEADALARMDAQDNEIDRDVFQAQLTRLEGREEQLEPLAPQEQEQELGSVPPQVMGPVAVDNSMAEEQLADMSLE